MPYRLERVSGRRRLREFVDLPRSLLAHLPTFVPPLTFDLLNRIDARKNPFFAHADCAFWILRDGPRAVGRISATVHRLSLEHHGDKTGFFGHVLLPNADGAGLLLRAATSFLAEHGLDRMRGPIELSTNYTCGLQVSGFDLCPRIDINQHPPGYEALLLAHGLEGTMDLIAYRMNRFDVDVTRLERARRVTEKRTMATIRNIDKRHFWRDVEGLCDVYNAAWSTNWGYSPFSSEEFRHAAKDFKRIVDPRLCQIAEVDGRYVGFILAVPDINAGTIACNGRLFPFGFLRFLRGIKKTDGFRVITLGVVPDMRRTGLDARLILEHIARSRDSGHNDAELSWVLEDNVPMVKPLLSLGAFEAMRHRLYERTL